MFKVTVLQMVSAVDRRKTWEIVETDDKGKPVYGYTPEQDVTVTREREVYTQRVENLDLAKLVAVVNGIGATK